MEDYPFSVNQNHGAMYSPLLPRHTSKPHLSHSPTPPMLRLAAQRLAQRAAPLTGAAFRPTLVPFARHYADDANLLPPLTGNSASLGR